MGYRELVQNNVNQAFDLVGNLALDAIFIKKLVTEFSFEDASTNVVTSTTKTVKVIPLNTAKIDSITNNLILKVLVKTEDIPDSDIYDKLKIEGITWDIKLPIKNDYYTSEITLSRGL